METIIAVAIKYGEAVIHMPRPCRHHDIIRLVGERFKSRTGGSDQQGFLTSEGRFVGRRYALYLTQRNGQLDQTKPRGSGSNSRDLFSEDLW